MSRISKESLSEQPTPTSGVRALADSRARYTHYCSDCRSCVHEDDDDCHMCGASRPGSWSQLSESEDPWLGERIADTYDVLSWIAEGSMSRVYRVRDTATSRDLVLKINRIDAAQTGLRDIELRPWPYREVDNQSALSNAHIVPIVDVVDLGDSAVGLVMEYVDGVTIRELVVECGPLESARALDLLDQTANGIHEAHRNDIVHRDIKPANLMVESLPGGDELVRILDFGIACPSGNQSRASEFVGTPLFASPEQIRQDELTRSSDIYSMGAVLFFMLTGQPPFVRETTSKVLEAHLSDNPPALSHFIDKCFEPEVERLVRKMLSKNPLARPRSVPALLNDIDAIRQQVDLSEDARGRSSGSLRERSEADTMELEVVSENDTSPDG